ncbi:hypothetical protein Tco_0881986, partial [Tanacetum coccineum]
ASLTQELKEYRTNLDETGRALGEATSFVNQKHDELVKKSLLTKSQLEGYLKENTKVISDLKVKEEKYIDKMIEMDKQLKFLNEIVYIRNQSIQTIHMLAPKCSTYNCRPTFANPRYLKKAQSEKPCLYEIPYDNSDHANRFTPEREETINKDAKSHKTTKRYMPVEKSSASKKPERQIPTGHRFSNKKTTTVPEKIMTPRSCLRWQPTGRIPSTDLSSARMVSQKMSYKAMTFEHNNSSLGRQCQMASAENNTSGPVPQYQASVFMAMTFEQRSSSLVLHQMTSDHNRSELGIHDHSIEQSSSKLVPKVVPLANKTATSRQELELLFHLHIAMLRTTAQEKG